VEWRWDPTLYEGSAQFYARGRMPYPEALADALRDELALDGTGRLLDVGCGTGKLTVVLAPLFAEVIGIDADTAMVAEATRRSPANATFRRLRAEELPADLGVFDVVAFAQSFHWMQQMDVARTVRAMLRPGGAFVNVGATTHEGDGDVPRAEIEALIRRYLGERPSTRSDERRNLGAVGFEGPTEIDVPRDEVIERGEDDVVASVFSLSYASPERLGERRAAFERDLRALLGGRTFHERPRGIGLLLYRKPG
jgi:SAM-dependent methyltransferase